MVLLGLRTATPDGPQTLRVKHHAIGFDLAALDAARDAAEGAFLRYRAEQAFARLLELEVEDRFLVPIVRVGQRPANPLARKTCSRARGGFRHGWRGEV